MPLNTWFAWEVVKLTQPRKRAFRVNRTYPKIVRNRKQRIARRLDPKRGWSDQPEPMMSASNIHFEMAERGRALNYGGIGAIHLMGQRLGLVLPAEISDIISQWLLFDFTLAPFKGSRLCIVSGDEVIDCFA